MTYKGKWPGTYAAICDVCGFRFPSDKLKKRWDGLMTCDADWETKHPQLFIKVAEERIAPPWVRPKEVYQFIEPPYIQPGGGTHKIAQLHQPVELQYA